MVDSIAQRLRAGLGAWFKAGGAQAPVILFHDESHGAPLIEAMAHQGRGLPAHVIPFQINEPSQIGPEIMATALAYGAGWVRVLAPARPAHPLTGLDDTLALMRLLTEAMGHGAGACALVQTDDPDALEAALWVAPQAARATRSSFLPPEDKRGLLTLSVAEMGRTAPTTVGTLPLPQGAPFGAVALNTDACTLCLSCVSACPAGALGDDPDKPTLRFTESACVQCGLCAATCPEDAIALVPQLDLAAWSAPKRILKEEEPFCCTSCGKAFGTKSSIDRVLGKLATHWMFTGTEGEKRKRLLTMCDDCRTREVVIAGFDPHEKPGS